MNARQIEILSRKADVLSFAVEGLQACSSQGWVPDEDAVLAVCELGYDVAGLARELHRATTDKIMSGSKKPGEKRRK